MVACLTLVKRHENAERDEREIHATTHVFENANHISINDTSDSDSETVLSTELKEAIISQEEPSVDFVQCFPRHIRLEKPVITLGRNKEECDVIISSPGIFQNRISRKHAILSLNEALRQWSIKDCGSVNGTFVNGSKIGPDGSVLVNDDIVQFGGSANETFEYCFHTDCVSANSTRSSRLHRQQPEEIGTEGESNPVTSMSPQHDSLSNATNSEASGAISVDYSSQSAEDSSGHSSIRGNSSSSSSSSGSNINNRALHRVVERDRMTRAVEGLGILSSACPVARQKRSRSGQEPEINKNKPIIELEMAKAKRNKLRNRTKIGEGDDHENVQEQKEERNNTLKTMMSDLRSELTCPICTELYQKTLTLDCGHSFCSDCIEKWLRESLTCPLCRTCLSKPPVLSHALDRSVQIIIEDDEAEKVAFLKRKAASDTVYKACLDKKNKLEGQLSEARRMGYRLCHIAHVWSRHEQFRFLQGIATFHGLSRQAYCDSVSLCEELVDRVSEDELAVFAYNLMLQRNTGTDPPSESETEEEKNLSYYVNWARKDVVELRSRILMFIKYG